MKEDLLSNFSTMPLRFRVWDSKSNESYSGCPIERAAELIKILGRNNVVISQDTGIRDKNEINIYTGDIIIDHGYTIDYIYKLTGFVTMSKIAAGYTISSPMNGYASTNLVLSEVNQYEVIGNIFANPNLLEEMNVGRRIDD